MGGGAGASAQSNTAVRRLLAQRCVPAVALLHIMRHGRGGQMNIKHRTRINPRMIERANNARRKARRAPIPASRIESDKRPAMIDRMVQQEMDDNDAHVQR
jgi:hypothetical protein